MEKQYNKWDYIIQEYLIKDPTISELETNGTFNIFARQNGKRVELNNVFENMEDYIRSTYNLIYKITKSTEEPKYLAEGKLDFGPHGTARCHIVLPPACDAPMVTIAKKTTSLTSLQDIFNSGSMSIKMYNFIKAAVDCKLNIVFSGGTGSGKTTFLEAITKDIPLDTRIGVVEDSPELRLIQKNVSYLHSLPWHPGMDPNNEVTIDWCMRQINRMRSDLVIIGETRGKEFKEFLTCANSGMEGSMTTLHANTPKLALQKMSQFVMEAKEQPIRIINKNIANSINLIIQLEKFPTGEYKTTAIEEVSNILGRDESAEIATTPLSVYNKVTKTWTDSFLISDTIRNKFVNKGYDCNTFVKSTSNPNRRFYRGGGY